MLIACARYYAVRESCALATDCACLLHLCSVVLLGILVLCRGCGVSESCDSFTAEAAAASDEAGSGSESEVDEEPAEEGEAMQAEVVGAVWADEWPGECRDIIVSQIVAGVVQRAAEAGRVVGGWAG